MPSSTPALAVLASGRGTNFEALVAAERGGRFAGRIVALMCDRPDAEAIARASTLGIEALIPPVGRFRTRIEDEAPWLEALRARGVEVLLLAGFLRRLHATLLEAYSDRILNIHPSLLPEYPGLDAIGQAWRSGASVTGCTVHLVTSEIDSGAILGSRAVERRAGDTLESLEARVHEAEHALYPECVRRYLEEPWRRERARIVWGEGAGFAAVRHRAPRAHAG